MVPALILANNFIQEAQRGRIKYLTPMKLQKLMYFTYGYYAAETEQPLFAESFQAWQYGPVLSSVYQEFKCFGSGEISSLSTDAAGLSYVMNWEEPRNATLKQIFDKVCDKFSNHTGLELSRLTHKENSPWANTLANGIIQFDAIKVYFQHEENIHG